MEYPLWNFHGGFWPGGNAGTTPPEGLPRTFYNSVNNGMPPAASFHPPTNSNVDSVGNYGTGAPPCRQNFRPQPDFGGVKGPLPLVGHHEAEARQVLHMGPDMMTEQSSMESVSSTVGGETMLDPSSSHDSSHHDAAKGRGRLKRSPPHDQWEGQEGANGHALGAVKTENNGVSNSDPTMEYLTQQSYNHPMYGMIMRGITSGKREQHGSDDTDDDDASGEGGPGQPGLPQPRLPVHNRSPPGTGAGEDSPSCSNALAAQRSGYECGECGLVADTRPGLKKHISMCHPLPNDESDLASALLRKMSSTVVCPMSSCRFRTSERNEMEAHVARHVAEGYSPNGKKGRGGPISLQRVRYEREEYRCQMCAYSCTIEKAFYKHLKVHSLGLQSSQVKISCVICGKDRTSEVDMNKHMRKHRDERYFCCDICIFKTVQLKKLIQHRRMHTGEKPHLCPHCSYRSARRDNLRSHVRRVHKKDNLFCDTFSPRGLLLTPNVAPPSPSPSHQADTPE